MAATSQVAEIEPLPTRIFLSPVAAPPVLGYYAGACGFLLFGLYFSGEITGTTSAVAMAPFLILFAGIGQLAAGLWCIRAREAAGAALFSMWGGFWIAYGILWLLVAGKVLKAPVFAHGLEPLGQWFMYMAVVSFTTALAALARNPLQCLGQAGAGVASGMAAAGLMAGAAGWETTAGWIFVATAGLFFYHASALMLTGFFERVILPHGSWRMDENLPGSDPLRPVEAPQGEPGVKVGQ